MADDVIAYSGPLVTRKEARDVGLSKFFTGVPCKHGHIAERRSANGTCLVCARSERARYRANHPERIAEVKASYYAANSERISLVRKNWYSSNKESIRATRAITRAANKGKTSEQNRRYRQANKENIAIKAALHRKLNAKSIAGWMARYYDANTDAFLAYGRARRARKRSAGGVHTKEDVSRIFQAQRGRCAYCRIKLHGKYHVDHIIPLSSGGHNAPSNIQVTCVACNLKKNKKSPEDFARVMGMLI